MMNNFFYHECNVFRTSVFRGTNEPVGNVGSILLLTLN